MNKEEFLNFINQSNKNHEAFKIAKANFKVDLTTQLKRFVLKHNAKIQNNPAQMAELKEATETTVMMAFEALQSTFDRQDLDKPYTPSKWIPKITSRKESQKELDEFLKLIPETEYDYATQQHWQDYEYEKEIQQFKKDIHDIVKKAFVTHYEEEIMELDGNSFHHLDGQSYSMATYWFIEKAFELVD